MRSSKRRKEARERRADYWPQTVPNVSANQYISGQSFTSLQVVRLPKSGDTGVHEAEGVPEMHQETLGYGVMTERRRVPIERAELPVSKANHGFLEQ